MLVLYAQTIKAGISANATVIKKAHQAIPLKTNALNNMTNSPLMKVPGPKPEKDTEVSNPLTKRDDLGPERDCEVEEVL